MSPRDPERLARLTHLRGVQENVARARWAQAEARADEARDRADRLADTLTRARAELDALLRQRAMADAERENYAAPLSVIEGHLEVARKELEVRIQDAAQQRAAWSETERDKRAVERLEERAVEHRDRGLREREDREADEVEQRRQGRLRAEEEGTS